MKNCHYELSDYILLQNMEKNALNMLKKHNSSAFKYILHNLYDQLRNYDSSLAEQIYEKFKYYEICAVDDGSDEIYEKAISKLQEMLEPLFQNMVVDLNEHNGI